MFWSWAWGWRKRGGENHWEKLSSLKGVWDYEDKCLPLHCIVSLEMKLVLNRAASGLQERGHCEQIDCLRWFDTFWFLLRKISVNPSRREGEGPGQECKRSNPSRSCSPSPNAKVWKSQLFPQDLAPHLCPSWHDIKTSSSLPRHSHHGTG